MPAPVRNAFLSLLESQFGRLSRVGTGKSLFQTTAGIRVYLRYSKVHGGRSTFYGLRKDDLGLLEGFPSFLAFLWDGQAEPLVLPFDQFAPVFGAASPAQDGQFKVHIRLSHEGTDLTLGNRGRFGVDAHFGVHELLAAHNRVGTLDQVPPLTHGQIQSILGWIGHKTGHSVFVPHSDRAMLDWSLVPSHSIVHQPPPILVATSPRVLEFIDVLWMHPTRHTLSAAFEVEHSTPIYSGLLRFNDVHLDCKLPRAGIVSDVDRRDAFYRQIGRRTFRASGLDEVCLFYSYSDVYRWFRRLLTPNDSRLESR
jgi:hypothetical protein